MTPLSALVGLKDEHVAWRAAGIRRLDDDGTVRRQAASPLPAFDDLVDVAAHAVRSAHRGHVVVADHGLGGFADALASRAGIELTALLSAHAYRHASGLFCSTRAIAGDIESMPVRDGSLAALIVGGIGTSLAPVLRRAREVLVPGGRLCMIGLVSADEERTSPRSLRVSSLDRLRTELGRANFSEPQCALASAELGEWMMIESALAGHIARERRGGERYDEWVDHRRLVQRLIDDRELLVVAAISSRDGDA